MCGRESSNGDGDWCIYVKNTFIDVPQEATWRPRHSRCKSTPGNYPLGSDLRETRGGPLETCLEDDFPNSWTGPPGTPGHQVRSMSGSASSALVADLRAVDPAYVPIPALAVAGGVTDPIASHSSQIPLSSSMSAAGQGELPGGPALAMRRVHEDFSSDLLPTAHPDDFAASKALDLSSPLQTGLLRSSSSSSRSNSLGPGIAAAATATAAAATSPTAAAVAVAAAAAAGQSPSPLHTSSSCSIAPPYSSHQSSPQTSADPASPSLAPAYVSFSAYSATPAVGSLAEPPGDSGAPLGLPIGGAAASPSSRHQHHHHHHQHHQHSPHPCPPPQHPPPPPPPSASKNGRGGGDNSNSNSSNNACNVKINSSNHNNHTELAPLPAEFSAEVAPTSRTIDGASSTTTGAGGSSRTTVMIRGLPADFTRAVLEDLFEQEGFRGCYNFMYVPIDIASGSSFFYAFVNLISPQEAARFFQHFTGFKNWPVPCDKESAVEWSESMQGVGELADRYRNSPLMHESVPDSLKPAMYKDGLRIAFPEPTKPIRAPRVRPPSAKKAEKLVLMRTQQGPIPRAHPM
eukprot:CAMPEP_0206551910 /NCGR_PEP_ID=MMETSP0325_2-20121206/15786_1 /ASSEMBLY_ACC=CAM_ASM_000347 /TAXON_ID=2866 /ORGANISM="Crypthecodinium cohnii, Strain Seligo" /LENGTH=572 /DNA_ID=CAMNT_0054051723 /DNA_START=144 /DNA_END=1862 /DNA_ORIENTATION=+